MADLDAPQRLAAIDQALLDPTPDPELQQITAEAAARMGCPIGVLSVVLRHIQFFRAQTGLPPDLAVSCGTSRSSSFCQFVVRSEEPFVVHDARNDPRVPAELVASHGIGAYLGVPVRHGGQIVGSLCVIDGAPRRFEPHQAALMQRLALRVERRLGQLDRPGDAPPASADHAKQTLRQVAESLQTALEYTRAMGHAAEALPRESIDEEALEEARITLTDALAFHDEVGSALGDMERTRASLPESLGRRVGPLLDELWLYHAEARTLARVVDAYLNGRLDPTSSARALSVSREAFALIEALATACHRLVAVTQEAP